MNVRQTLLLMIACILVVAGVTVPVASTNDSEPEWNTASLDLPEDHITKGMYIDLNANGDATVKISITYLKMIDGDNGRYYADRSEYYYGDVNSAEYESLTANMTATMTALAARGTEYTDRDMSVELVDQSGTFDTHQGLTYWYTFKWTNLAAADDTSVTVTEPFAQDYAMFDQRTVISFTGPSAMSNVDASPEPTSTSGAYAKYSGASMDRLVVSFTSDTATTEQETNTTPTTAAVSDPEPRVPQWVYAATVLVAVLLALVTVGWRRDEN